MLFAIFCQNFANSNVLRRSLNEWTELCDKWLQSIENQNTRRVYRSVVKAMGEYFANSPYLVTSDNISRYIDYLSNTINSATNRPYTPSTIKQYVSAIKSFFSFVNVNSGSNIDVLHNNSREVSELESLKTMIDRSTQQGKRDYAILMLLLSTSLKIGDLTHLTLGNLRKYEDSVAIERRGQLFELSIEAGEAVNEYVITRENLTNNSPLFTATVAGKRAIKNRGLESSIERALSSRMITKLLTKYRKRKYFQLLKASQSAPSTPNVHNLVELQNTSHSNDLVVDQSSLNRPIPPKNYTTLRYHGSAERGSVDTIRQPSSLISVQHINYALKSVISSPSAKHADYLYKNGLAGLTLVAQFLEDPTLPELDPDFLLNYAVNSVLINHIIEQYTRLRLMFGLTPPNIAGTLTECERCISEDASTSTASDRLLIWSWLYHHYVRDELSISSTMFSKYVSRNNRSLRRYQKDALYHLARSLSDAEQQARNNRQQTQLLASVPGIGDVRLYGRDTLLQRVIGTVSNAKPAHFIISGGRGTGKTAFVQHITHYFIESFKTPLFNAVVWIYNPTSVEGVYHQVSEHLHLPLMKRISTRGTVSVELRTYLLRYNVLIVIDSLDYLDRPAEAANEILQALGAATIVMTTQSTLTVKSSVHTLLMRDLNKSEVVQFCQDMTDLEPHLAEQLATELITQVGGNPYALRIALNHYSDIYDAVQLPYADILNNLFHVNFSRLDPMAQRLWCACALMPDEGLAIENLTAVWPSYYFNGVTILLSQHILRKVSNGVLYIESSAQRFIRSAYERPDDKDVQHMMDEVVHHLVLAIKAGEVNALPFAEHILRTRWPIVPSEFGEYWFEMILKRFPNISHRTEEVLRSLQRAGEEQIHSTQLDLLAK